MMKQKLLTIISGAILAFTLAGCSSSDQGKVTSNNEKTIIKNAKKEGSIISIGMPDTWANFRETWQDLTKQYGLKHSDTDMSSAEEVQKFKSAGTSSSAPDIGDIGLNVAPTAVKQNLVVPYKTKYWKDIPAWAKDKDGKYAAVYQGSIAFITDTKNVSASQAPKSWKDLLSGKYKVAIGDVSQDSQAQYAVLAAAFAHGGSESNLKPGLDYFKKLQKQNRLSSVETVIQNFQKGEIQVGVVWDFNALNYAHQIDSKRYKITIPTDGTVTSGYTEILNKNAPHPYAAKLAHLYTLSDQGQINLAKGYARPIRSNVKLPKAVADKLLPASDYKKVFHVANNNVWNQETVKLGQAWQSEVLN